MSHHLSIPLINPWAATPSPSSTGTSAAQYILGTEENTRLWPQALMEDFLGSCNSKGTGRKYKNTAYF